MNKITILLHMIFQLGAKNYREPWEKKYLIKIYSILFSSAAWLKGGEGVLFIYWSIHLHIN